MADLGPHEDKTELKPHQGADGHDEVDHEGYGLIQLFLFLFALAKI